MAIINKIFSVKEDTNKLIIIIFGFKFTVRPKWLDYKYNLQVKTNSLKTYLEFLNNLHPASTLPKAKGNLREGQKICLEIMKDVKKLCEENNLTYWIAAGSLLGAVRHKGFIPWDNEGDFCMLRDDYNKIIPILKEHYKDSDITVRETGFTHHYQIRLIKNNSNNLGIDIFPYDKYYKPYDEIKDKEKVERTIRKAVKKLGRKSKNKKFSSNVEIARKYIKEVINDKMIRKGNVATVENPSLFIGVDFPWKDPKKLLVPYNRIFPLKTIVFENEEFNCPNNVHEHLVNSYGTHYMEYPPGFKYSSDKISEYIESLKE